MSDASAAPSAVATSGSVPAGVAPEFAGYYLPRRTKMLILGGAMAALFMASMEQTVVATAIPRIVSDLSGLNLIAWVTTAFMLTSVVAVPIAGRLSDIYGRKPLLLGGLVVFLIGSALAGFSQDMTQLVLFRGLQGLGAGVLMANTMAISGDLFPPAERGKYMGLFAGVFGISAVIGPTLGGFLTDNLTWRWVFWINVPLGVLATAGIFFLMPWLRPAKRKVQIDYTGVLALIWALVPALLALALVGGSATWTDTHILLMFAASAVGLIVFIANERRAAEPIVPLELFGNHTFRTAAVVMVAMGIGVFGVIFFIPLFVQGVIGESATRTGSIITPQMLAVVVMAAVGGLIISRTGRYKYMAVAGAIFLIVSMLAMTQLSVDSSLGNVIWRLVLFGIGMGLTFPTMMIAVQNAVPQRYLGTVTSSNSFFQQIGGLIGVTVFGTLLNTRLESYLANNLSPELLAVANPEQLVDPGRRATAIAEIGPDAFLVVAEVVREGLASAIIGNFWISVGILGVVLVALLQLRELRLRQADDRGVPDEAEPGAAAPAAAPAAAEAETETGAEPEAVAATELDPLPNAADEPGLDPDPEGELLPQVGPATAASPGGGWSGVLAMRLPPLPLAAARRRQGELLGAVALGSVLGLAATIGARGNGRRGRSRRRETREGRTGAVWATRRRLADRLAPLGADKPAGRRRWR